MFDRQFTGDILGVFNNPHGVYEGNLRPYFKVICEAPNVHHSYHGLRHMLHVTWVCYQACIYYRRLNLISLRQGRNLLVGAIFHDYGHVGKVGNDADNILVALNGMKVHLVAEDTDFVSAIGRVITATGYPHSQLADTAPLEMHIIRDADISQALGPVWIGDIVAGLGKEQGKTPAEMLSQQLQFLQNARFHTDFGKVFYGQEAIMAKIRETEGLLKMLA